MDDRRVENRGEIAVSTIDIDRDDVISTSFLGIYLCQLVERGWKEGSRYLAGCSVRQMRRRGGDVGKTALDKRERKGERIG